MTCVALTNYEYPPNCGGGGVFTADLADALRDRGHEVRVVADDRDRPTSSLPAMLSFPVRSLPSAAASSLDADVLNGHFAVPSSAALPAVSALANTPFVCNLMGADVHDPTRYNRVRPFIDAAVEHWIGRYADALVVPSTDMARRIPDSLRDKTHVIPYFVDHTTFTRGNIDPTPPLRLLTVARLVERKRLDRAIRAVRLLTDRGHDVHYTIAGDGPERESLARCADDAGVGDRVTFAGYVEDSALPGLYRSHDVLVLPSAHEAFGIAVLEALASGLPAVVSDTGGQTDIVTDDVGRCTDPSPPALASAIAEVYDEQTTMSIAARKRVLDRYTAAEVVTRYERLYEEVAG